MVFSFNFSPIVSSFVVSKREEYEKDFGRDFTERKCSQIISRASMLMVAVVMFFAFSCLFTLSPANMAEAKAQNIPVLSYLANHFASMTGTKQRSRLHWNMRLPSSHSWLSSNLSSVTIWGRWRLEWSDSEVRL
ncbi:threonine/serine transporter [Escherichia coli]|uniref:Threonine/serine transporter n=1 Tax=Escherichia coli TaxID=562 RepID=A0A377A8W6_ECOLX|nr:threonine/serine transporter [Escherichia coli]